MNRYVALLLIFTSYNASTAVYTDLSAGVAISETIGESISSYRVSSAYYTDNYISYGASLSYLDFNQDVTQKYGGELFVAPYVKTDRGNIISSDIGFRNDVDKFFLGFTTRINANDSIYLLASVRWYSDISSHFDSEYFDFSLGLSYNWSGGQEDYYVAQDYEVENKLPEPVNAVSDIDVEPVVNVIESYSDDEMLEILETADESVFEVYYLKKGDYLYKLARENGITFKQLVDLNARFPKIKNLDVVYPGMMIYLPPKKR